MHIQGARSEKATCDAAEGLVVHCVDPERWKGLRWSAGSPCACGPPFEAASLEKEQPEWEWRWEWDGVEWSAVEWCEALEMERRVVCDVCLSPESRFASCGRESRLALIRRRSEIEPSL